MAEGNLLHPVSVHIDGPGEWFARSNPSLCVAHPVIDLQGVYPLEIEIDKEWRRGARMFLNGAGSELSLDAIQQATVIPVIVAFAEDRSLVSLALVGPQVGVTRQPRRQHARTGDMRVHVSMRRWSDT